MVTTQTLPPPLAAYYRRKLLKAAEPALIHSRWLQLMDMPKNEGEQLKAQRYSNLAPATTPISEGVTPAGVTPTVTAIFCTPQQYGSYIPFTDRVSLVHHDPLLDVFSEKLGQQAGQTFDELVRDVLISGTQADYADSSGTNTTATVDGVLTTTLLKRAIRTLKRNDCKPIYKMIKGSVNVGTQPIRAAYVGIIHPDTAQTLESLPGFIPASDYPQGDALEDEVGSWREIRFFQSSIAAVERNAGVLASSAPGLIATGTRVDVYKTLIFGADFAARVNLAGGNLQQYVKPVGSSGAADPLNQRGTIGWKAWFGAVITNDDFGVRIEHGNLEDPV